MGRSHGGLWLSSAVLAVLQSRGVLANFLSLWPTSEGRKALSWPTVSESSIHDPLASCTWAGHGGSGYLWLKRAVNLIGSRLKTEEKEETRTQSHYFLLHQSPHPNTCIHCESFFDEFFHQVKSLHDPVDSGVTFTESPWACFPLLLGRCLSSQIGSVDDPSQGQFPVWAEMPLTLVVLFTLWGLHHPAPK